MKQFLYISFLAVVIAACNDNTETAVKESTTTVKEESSNNIQSNTMQLGINDADVDTLGIAEFLAMKAAEAGKNRQSNDITVINDVNVDTIGFAAFKRMKAETARHASEDSTRRLEIIAEHNKYNDTGNADSRTNGKTTKQKKSVNKSISSDQKEVAKESPAPVKEKKGWSNTAKGVVIGAATGATAGAVINKKNRGVGGVVGGVVGAAAGYRIGRQKDKKDGVKKDTTDRQQ